MIIIKILAYHSKLVAPSIATSRSLSFHAPTSFLPFSYCHVLPNTTTVVAAAPSLRGDVNVPTPEELEDENNHLFTFFSPL